MAPTSFYLALLSAATALGEPVALKFNRRETFNHLAKRSSTYPVYLHDYIPFGEYFVTIGVGTPAQEVELVLDTGSSDLWMFGAGSCGYACNGGVFDPTQSSTFETVKSNAFQEKYADGSYVSGDYIKDTVQIGGMTIDGQEMGLAQSEKDENTGIMGIAFSSGESGYSSGYYPEYPNVVASMKSNGLIKARAFSLYLDDLAEGHGTIIFGGYDKKKFTGDLVMLPIEPDEQDGKIDSFTVSFTSLSATDSKGSSITLESATFPHAAVLDSGTTYTYLPDELFFAIAEQLGIYSYEAGGQTSYGIDCDIGSKFPGATLDYGFGGDNGVIIAVPLTELAVPYYYTNNGSLSNICSSGVQPRGDLVATLFGQTFLRSAYVMYDEDTPAVGLAPTVFDESGSDIVEYTPGGSNTFIRTDAAAPTVPWTSEGGASPTVNPGGGGSGGYQTGGYSSGGAVSSVAGPVSGVKTVATSLAISRPYPSSGNPTAVPTTLGPQTAVPTGGSSPAVIYDTRMLGVSISLLACILFGGALLA